MDGSPSSRTLAFSGNSLPYGYQLATPDDIASQYDRAMKICYGDGVVTVKPHGEPFSVPGVTCQQMIEARSALVDAQLRADPTGLAVMVHNEYVNDRVLATYSMADTIAHGRTWCSGRRLTDRVRVLNTTMAATPWAAPSFDAKFQQWEASEKYAIDAEIINGTGAYWDDVVDLRYDDFIGRDNSTAAHREQFLAYPPSAVEIHRNNRGYAREKLLGFYRVAAQLDLPEVPALFKPNGSLLSYWKLSGPGGAVVGNENPGGLVLDHCGTELGVNHLGKFPGGLTYNPAGDAALFTASSGFLQTSDSFPQFSTLESVQFKPSGFGICAWFKPEDSTNSKQLIAGAWTGTAWDYGLLWDAVAGKFYFSIKGNGSSCTGAEAVVASDVRANDEWHFLCGWFDGDQAHLSVGDAYGNLTDFAPVARPAVLPVAGTTNLFIGGSMFGWRLEGEVASVALLSRSPSTSDREVLYARGNRKAGLCQ